MRPLVSVIMPVYKVEDVLTRCLDSLGRQSLQNIEILLIDDGSPDRCGAICNAYVEKDSRFRVFHHPKNRGLSVARNTGIENATADYLMFVDSDDYVHKDFCKLPYECAVQNDVDLVMFGYQRINKNGSCKLTQKMNSESGIKTRMDALDLLFNAVGIVAWNKLYRKKLFDTVSYPEGYLFEDVGTTHKTVLLANSIYYL
ncbi:MAG: glycosyltransferase family 2 protein, partial [Acidaminococcaceae bacterium]|nr:glycosyltransferase family 2 protein [Acidaminococcaceae bacterium]